MPRGRSETFRDEPMMLFASQDAWARWLAKNHQTADGLWLKIAKKGTGTSSVSYAEALDVALCYGWIDGQKGKLDDEYWLQRFTRRKPRSKWSKINCDKVAELIAHDRMAPPGMREVEQARADGRWDAAYASQSAATVPDDLQQALDADPAARTFFESLDRGNRYAILYRVHEAKKPETRAKRIATYVQMLSEHRTIHPRRNAS